MVSLGTAAAVTATLASALHRRSQVWNRAKRKGAYCGLIALPTAAPVDRRRPLLGSAAEQSVT